MPANGTRPRTTSSASILTSARNSRSTYTVKLGIDSVHAANQLAFDHARMFREVVILEARRHADVVTAAPTMNDDPADSLAAGRGFEHVGRGHQGHAPTRHWPATSWVSHSNSPARGAAGRRGTVRHFHYLDPSLFPTTATVCRLAADTAPGQARLWTGLILTDSTHCVPARTPETARIHATGASTSSVPPRPSTRRGTQFTEDRRQRGQLVVRVESAGVGQHPQPRVRDSLWLLSDH
jgi:hypothetical protein